MSRLGILGNKSDTGQGNGESREAEKNKKYDFSSQEESLRNNQTPVFGKFAVGPNSG